MIKLGSLDAVLAAAIFCVALVSRAPLITHGQTLLQSDEAIVGIMAQDIAEGRRFPIYFYGQRYMGALEAYIVAGLRPLFDDPLIALRFGPALVFAALAAVQYLMLARWFGRAAAAVGALALVASSPMFAHWSVSARGGYIEILLCGTMLLWAYGEWFVARRPKAAGPRRLFAFGAIVGLGFWINPSIAAFVAPVVIHAWITRQPKRGPVRARTRALAARLGPAALPAVLVVALLAMNVVYSVRVVDSRVQTRFLLNLLPHWAELLIVAGALALCIRFISRHPGLVRTARRNAAHFAPALGGALAGATPTIIYLVGGILRFHPLDPSLPLGVRPLWHCGETLGYLARGLPLLFAADPSPFLWLAGFGRDAATSALPPSLAPLVSSADWLVLGAIAAIAATLLISRWTEIRRALRLEPAAHSPFVFLLFGTIGLAALYVLGGCTVNFSTVRYLVPLWAFVPGLLAAAWAGPRFNSIPRPSPSARVALVVLLGAWGLGQRCMAAQIGRPHPLQDVADALVAHRVPAAIAELPDAHLLTCLTNQRCRVVEFDPFWPRLSHLRPAAISGPQYRYVVHPGDVDRAAVWIAAGWPGDPPPESHRLLWPTMQRFLRQHPDALIADEPLATRYRLLTLDRPLPESTDRAIRPLLR